MEKITAKSALRYSNIILISEIPIHSLGFKLMLLNLGYVEKDISCFSELNVSKLRNVTSETLIVLNIQEKSDYKVVRSELKKLRKKSKSCVLVSYTDQFNRKMLDFVRLKYINAFCVLTDSNGYYEQLFTSVELDKSILLSPALKQILWDEYEKDPKMPDYSDFILSDELYKPLVSSYYGEMYWIRKSGIWIKAETVLTKREINILVYVASGAMSKKIAEMLGLSAKTVEVHQHNILKKTGFKTVAQLARNVKTGLT